MLLKTYFFEKMRVTLRTIFKTRFKNQETLRRQLEHCCNWRENVSGGFYIGHRHYWESQNSDCGILRLSKHKVAHYRCVSMLKCMKLKIWTEKKIHLVCMHTTAPRDSLCLEISSQRKHTPMFSLVDELNLNETDVGIFQEFAVCRRYRLTSTIWRAVYGVKHKFQFQAIAQD